MMPHDVSEGIQQAVRRALIEELPKVLEPLISRLSSVTIERDKAPELLSRKQAAALLGVSLQTIASLIAAGTLHIIRVRRRVLIPSTEIFEYLERQSAPTRTGGQ